MCELGAAPEWIGIEISLRLPRLQRLIDAQSKKPKRERVPESAKWMRFGRRWPRVLDVGMEKQDHLRNLPPRLGRETLAADEAVRPVVGVKSSPHLVE